MEVIIVIGAAVALTWALIAEHKKRRAQPTQPTQPIQIQRQKTPITPQDIYQEYEAMHQYAIHQASGAAANYLQTGPTPEAINNRIVLGAPVYPELYEMPIPPLHQKVMQREKLLKILEAISNTLGK